MAENLYRKATGDGREAVIAAIFWLKTRAGWKETTVQEHSAKDDPVVVIKRYIVDPREPLTLDLKASPPQPAPLPYIRERAY